MASSMRADRVQGAIAKVSSSASNASETVTEIFAFIPASFQISRISILLHYSTARARVTSVYLPDHQQRPLFLPVNLSVIMCIYAAACWGNHSCSHCWLSSTTFKMNDPSKG